MLAKRCVVLISRANRSNIPEIIPKVVWEFEIPCLERAFGEGRITRSTTPRMVINPKTKAQVEAGVQQFPIVELDYEEEYERLGSIYGRDMDKPDLVVEICYGYKNSRQMEILAEAKYRPLIAAGHTFKKYSSEDEWQPPADPIRSFDNPEDLIDGIDTQFLKENAELHSGSIDPSQEVEPFNYKAALQVDVTKLMTNPANVTVSGLKAALTDMGVPFDPELSKDMLHKLLLDNQAIPDDPETGPTLAMEPNEGVTVEESGPVAEIAGEEPAIGTPPEPENALQG